MKVSQDLKMYKGKLYCPLCFGEGVITYVKITPADAFVVMFDDSDPESDAIVIDGANAEAAATLCIQKTREHMSNIDNMIVVDDSVDNFVPNDE